MKPLSSEARQLRQLRKLPIVEAVPKDRWDALSPHISFVDLAEGESLFSAGTQSENLFLVVDGELSLFVPKQNMGMEENFYLHSRIKGDTAGDFAVLNGGVHLVSAQAAKKTRVAKFPRVAFELLTDLDPTILSRVYDTAAELSRRVTVAKVFHELFGELTTETMEELLNSVYIKHFKNGDVLFNEGDKPDGLHVVLSGRLNVESTDANNQPVLIAEVQARESVGELAMINGGNRSATVYATRESTVAFLTRENFDRIIRTKPTMMLSLAKMIVGRHTTSHNRYQRRADRTFVLVPLDKDLPLRRIVQQMKRQMRSIGKPLLLDARDFDLLYGKSGVSQTPLTHDFNTSITEWLDDKETSFSEIIYVADSEWNAWTQRCINRADKILLLASATTDNSAEIRSVEKAIDEHYINARVKPAKDLVLLHPSDTKYPSKTARWLKPRDVHTHHHVRLDDKKHLARLTRRMCGLARGLVFSGGGARGYAHLGVQRLLEEHEIDIDYFGGSSMGGLLAASMAMGHPTSRIMDLSKTFANKRALFDYTLPMTSLMKSMKLTHFCKSVYRQVRIEDLWTPFFCVSSNLSDGQEVIHDQGELWRVVRSTISLPGVFSPVPTPQGQLLIDGAVLNTFPVDIMDEKLGGSGKIIGVNVSQIAELRHYYDYGTSLSGWKVLGARLRGGKNRSRMPRIAETLLRSTDIKSIARLLEVKQLLDVLIEPDVSHISLLDFKSYARISDIGYAEAKRVFQECGIIELGCDPIESASVELPPTSDAETEPTMQPHPAP
ncbi:MAG: cyclic nucleotide-binding domain-containing protein [Gammaproteobacteria bacterium]|nr:cyclic nucleotide-binding domain-containing protein [Gammaproteobacteria bacterium]